jgi:thiol-disulfide isomerase/thioredoxin
VGVALLATRITVSAVFLIAGAGKLSDLPGSRRAAAAFGLPELLARYVGVLLPVGELAIGVALLVNRLAWWGGLAGLLLLLAFIGGISVSLIRGRTPDCHCFGQIHSEPIGATTLLRNGVLALGAAFIVLSGKSSAGVDPLAWTTTFNAGQRLGVILGVAAVGLLVAQSVYVIHLRRRVERMARQLSSISPDPAGSEGAHARGTLTLDDGITAVRGLPVGSPAPRFTLPDLGGVMVTLDDLLAGQKPVLLLFTNPGCGPCAALVPEIAQWQREHPRRLTVAVVGEGSAEANRPKAEETGLRDVLLQREREIAKAYDVSATPGAVIVYPNGLIGSPVALGAEEIRGLLGKVLELIITAAPIQLQGELTREPAVEDEPSAVARSIEVGQPLPHVLVTEFTGKKTPLGVLVHGKTLLLFWRSSCGFCQQMQARIEAWEADPPPGAPSLLVILTESPHETQVVRFRSLVVLDRGSAAARALGATGTPMGLLIDAGNQVASPLAVGERAIMDLIDPGEEARSRSA